MIDMRCLSRLDGLYRTCFVCGDEFKLASDSFVALVKQTHSGERYTALVERTANYPHSLMQTVCPKCQTGTRPDPMTGRHDPRAHLRLAGLESWADEHGGHG